MKFYPTSLQLCAQAIDAICMNWCISNSSLSKPAKATTICKYIWALEL